MDLVIRYWKEEEGYDTYSSDNGVCAYSTRDGEFFIAHYIVEKGKAYKFWEEIKELTKQLDCTYCTANVDLNESNKEEYTRKLLIFLKHGFKVISITNSRVTILKQL